MACCCGPCLSPTGNVCVLATRINNSWLENENIYVEDRVYKRLSTKNGIIYWEIFLTGVCNGSWMHRSLGCLIRVSCLKLVKVSMLQVSMKKNISFTMFFLTLWLVWITLVLSLYTDACTFKAASSFPLGLTYFLTPLCGESSSMI